MVSYVIYLHMSFIDSLVVSYVIYLHMSFIESLGGFIEKLLAIIHPEWRPSWILRWLTLDTHLKTIP